MKLDEACVVLLASAMLAAYGSESLDPIDAGTGAGGAVPISSTTASEASATGSGG